jgi:starvation-inducible DNA-binding protein
MRQAAALPGGIDMHSTKNTLDAATRGKSIVLLGMGLIHALDIERHAKQAHWNVRGPNFKALHELFDDVAQQAEDASDLLAERVVALGGTADGRTNVVANCSTLLAYPIDASIGNEHVEALSVSIASFGTLARDAIDQAGSWGDADTGDIFTEISRALDKTLWLVEAHAA